MSRSPALEAHVGLGTDTVPAPFLYRVLRPPLRALLERLFDFTVAGLEHLPDTGPFIVAANHHNYLDGIVLAVAIPRPISFLVMPRVYRATPIHPLLHRHVGSIRIDLERPGVGALRRALRTLAAGRI